MIKLDKKKLLNFLVYAYLAIILTNCSFIFKPSVYVLKNGGSNVYIEEVNNQIFLPGLEENFQLQFKKHVYQKSGLSYTEKAYADITISVSLVNLTKTSKERTGLNQYQKRTTLDTRITITDTLKTKDKIRSENLSVIRNYISENQQVDGVEQIETMRYLADQLAQKILQRISKQI